MARIPDNPEQPIGAQVSSEFNPTRAYLPHINENPGGQLLGAEITKAGETLSKLAALQEHREQQNALAKISAQFHMDAYDLTDSYRDANPRDVLAGIPQDFQNLKQRTLEGLPENLANAAGPILDRIGVSYLKNATNQVRSRFDRLNLADDLQTFQGQMEAYAKTGDVAILGQMNQTLDTWKDRPYWDPVHIVEYKKKLNDMQTQAGIHYGMDNIPAIDQRMATLGTPEGQQALGVTPDKVANELSQLQQRKNLLINGTMDRLRNQFGRVIPPAAIDAEVKAGNLSGEHAVELGRQATYQGELTRMQQDPVAYKKFLDQGGNKDLIAKDPETYHRLDQTSRSLSSELQKDNGDRLLKMWLNNDPNFSDTLTKAKTTLGDYYHPQTLKMLDQMLKTDEKKSDPDVHDSFLLRLNGPLFNDKNERAIEIGEIAANPSLSPQDKKYFATLWDRRYTGVLKPQEAEKANQVKAILAPIKNVLNFDVATGTGLEHDPVGANLLTRFSNNQMQAFAKEYEKLLKDNPGAKKEEIAQIALPFIQAAKNYATLGFLQERNEVMKKQVPAPALSNAWNLTRGFAGQTPPQQPVRPQPTRFYRPGMPAPPPAGTVLQPPGGNQ